MVPLSNDLVSQFVKATNDSEQPKKESTAYGTIVEYNGAKYVKLDGSDLLTPISTTTAVDTGERVQISIKNHTATVTGNISSPSGKDKDVKELGTKISEFEIIIADKVSVGELEAEIARIDALTAENLTIKKQLTANEADIRDLEAEDVKITGRLDAAEANIDDLDATKLDAEVADIKYATVENLEATNADIHDLEADYGDFKDLTTDKFEAQDASIEELQTKKLDAESAEIKFANIDFSNIGKAAIEEFFSKSGMISDLVVGEGTVTGKLVGVTIIGDLIEGGTVKADKLVIQGEDGLYYKLNTNGETISAEQTEYNSLNGSIITAKSVTAEKISVSDLVAFDATIGGFNITDKSVYSGVKESVDNTTRGIYLDSTGQLAVGDSSNYLKYFKDTDGLWKLQISAGSISLKASNKDLETVINELEQKTDKAMSGTIEEFYHSSSPTELLDGSWSEESPEWTDGRYVWRRTKTTFGDGSISYTPSEEGVCISGNTGNKGEDGKDSIFLQILSSNGSIFKNTSIATTLTAHVYKGGVEVTGSSLTALGTIKWYKDEGATAVATGTNLTINPGDVTNNASYTAKLEG